jgi:hypothetical protein
MSIKERGQKMNKRKKRTWELPVFDDVSPEQLEAIRKSFPSEKPNIPHTSTLQSRIDKQFPMGVITHIDTDIVVNSSNNLPIPVKITPFTGHPSKHPSFAHRRLGKRVFPVAEDEMLHNETGKSVSTPKEQVSPIKQDVIMTTELLEEKKVSVPIIHDKKVSSIDTKDSLISDMIIDRTENTDSGDSWDHKQEQKQEQKQPSSPIKNQEPPTPVLIKPMTTLNTMQLPEYCMTLPINYHVDITDMLMRHMDGNNRDNEYNPKIILLTGNAGCGKTFCIQRACEMAGYDYAYLDVSEEVDDQAVRDLILSRPDLDSPNALKNIKISIVDAIDGFEGGQINKVCKIIQNFVHPRKDIKTKKNPAVNFRVNMIVLTANTRYSKHISSWIYKLKPVEIKMNTINYSQTNDIARKACEYMNIPMDAKVYKLTSTFGDNLTSLLMKIQWLSYGVKELDPEIIKNDETNLDIFSCCKSLLEPKEVDFKTYNSTWERGGEKIMSTIFNSYPDYVNFIPETPDMIQTFLNDNEETVNNFFSLRQQVQKEGFRYKNANFETLQSTLSDYKEYKDGFSKGLVSMHNIAEAFSEFNITPIISDIMEYVLQLQCKVELEDIFARSVKKRRIELKIPYVKDHTECLAKCMIHTREAEKLWFVNTIHNIEIAKKLKDFQYIPDPRYELSENIGRYLSLVNEKTNQWVIMDLFAEDKSSGSEEDTKLRKPKKDKKGVVNTHPKLECIQLFSYNFLKNEVVSTAKVKLPNGQFVSRKRTVQPKED